MGPPPKPHGSRDILGGQVPAYRAVAKFRKRHPSASGNLFVQALELCQAAGMVKLGRVALDGTKVRATAWRRRAMSCARMSDKQKVLPEQVSALLADGAPQTTTAIARGASVSAGVVRGMAQAGLLLPVALPARAPFATPDTAHPGPALSGAQAAASETLRGAVASRRRAGIAFVWLTVFHLKANALTHFGCGNQRQRVLVGAAILGQLQGKLQLLHCLCALGALGFFINIVDFCRVGWRVTSKCRQAIKRG